MRSTRQILIIEDDTNIGMLLDHMLSRQYDVVTLRDGHSALSWMAEGSLPDLILADVDMPGMESSSLLENLRVSGFYRHIPVVMMTGTADEEMARRLIAQGARDVLVKPFAREDLFALLGRLVPVY